MVKVNCTTKDSIRLLECVPFQGTLKKRTEQDLAELKTSIMTEGLLMPFAVWVHDDKKYLLDGHGRRQVLMSMIDEWPEVIQQDWPCVYIDAETEDDARKALLQISSQYGKITKQGYKQFCVSIPNYKAPSIQKFVVKQANEQVKPQTQTQSAVQSDMVVIKVKVKKDKLEQVKEIFKQFDFIEVL